MTAEHKNVILLISDTFRYDNLFDRAEMPVRTPNLDRFAERAVSMSRTYISSFPTIPHRADLTSGRVGWPWHGWQDRRLGSKNHIPELLGQADYVSQLLCDCPHLFGNSFNVGFDAAFQIRGQEGDKYFLRMNRPIEHVTPPEKTRPRPMFHGGTIADLSRWQDPFWCHEEDRFPPRLATMTTKWLEENYQSGPFFLWVDFFDPHEPWDPPEYMVRRYDGDYADQPMVHPNYGPSDVYSPAELKNLRAHYCAEAELVDRWVGRVLQKIDDLGLWDNSIVVFTSDHGISLGEHDRTGKSNMSDADKRYWPLYPDLAHVPLMIAAPGITGGRTVDDLLQPVDILPTVLELAGANVNPPEPFHGQSFAPLLRGESQSPIRDAAISGYRLYGTRSAPAEKQNTPVIYTKQWAYVPIGPAGGVELFDLTEDPQARTNIASEHPQVVKDLHGRLLDWLRRVKAPKETIKILAR